MIMKRIKAEGIEVIICEPELNETSFFNSNVVQDLNESKERSDSIIANRMTLELRDVSEKVFTRDLYSYD